MVKAALNEPVERYWAKKKKWLLAKVIGERLVGKRRKHREVRIRFVNENTPRNDIWLKPDSKELRAPMKYLDAFKDHTGYIEDDQWLAEKIVEERGRGKLLQYKIRYAGWSSDWDAWLCATDIGSDLIADWKAVKAASEAAAARFPTEEERARAAEHAASTIEFIAGKLVDKLRRQKSKGARHALVKVQPCDQWLFDAIYERLAAELPTEELGDYISPPKQIAGVRGTSPAVAYQFNVCSAVLLSDFLNEEQEATRSGHAMLRDTHPPTAVSLVVPVTFTRRGRRDKPSSFTLQVTAGFCALAGRNNGTLDWHFMDNVQEEDREAAKLALSDALVDMHERNPGVVSQQLLEEAERITSVVP